jgi:hypothetical protein
MPLRSGHSSRCNAAKVSGDFDSTPWVRSTVAIAISFLPIFAANVIFAKRFAATANAPLAFATNLFGAIIGGCLEYLSLVFGYHALLIIAAILYAGAFSLTPRPSAAQPEREMVAA